MQAKTALILLVFVAGVGAVASQIWPGDPATPVEVPAAQEPEVSVTTDSPEEIKGDAPAPKVKKKEPFTLEEENKGISADRLQLPNGKSVPILNGAYGAKNGWPSQIPYSPIIKVEIDGNGERYYLHADGSQTKTLMVRDSVSGKVIACTQVSNPTDVVPMDPTELSKVRVGQEERKRAMNRLKRMKGAGKKNAGKKNAGKKK